MAIEITSTHEGILTLKVSGVLTQSEFAASQQRAIEIIQQRGKVRFLVLVDGFAGFEKGADWSDVSFQFENDAFIEKMAIVGDKKWEDLTLVFTGKGIRSVPIEYFAPHELAKAQAWVAA